MLPSSIINRWSNGQQIHEIVWKNWCPFVSDESAWSKWTNRPLCMLLLLLLLLLLDAKHSRSALIVCNYRFAVIALLVAGGRIGSLSNWQQGASNGRLSIWTESATPDGIYLTRTDGAITPENTCSQFQRRATSLKIKVRSRPWLI